MKPADLVRLAELMQLAAATVKQFRDTTGNANAQTARIAELGETIQEAADELLGIARKLAAREARSQ